MNSAPARRRIWRWLQPVVVLAILAAVASRLPFEDQLILSADGGGEERHLTGSITGDWKQGQVVFHPSEAPAEPRVLRQDKGGSWNADGQPAELRPSMQRVFASVHPGGLALAFLAFFTALSFGITRWWRLLWIAGCNVRWWDAFRLTYLGMFFNLVVPGLTGGDVVKAVLAVRENPGRRADALVSVVMDRLLGLVALAALAMVVIVWLGGPFEELRLPMALALVAMVVGALVYTSTALRRLVRFESLLARLPLGQRLLEVDRAVLVYTRRPGEVLLAFALSLGNHFAAIAGVMALGVAFGVPQSVIGWWQYVAIVPVANIVSALPIAPGGWGVGEAAFHFLFELVGASGAMGVAVSVTYRLCQLVVGLLGGLYLLRPARRAELRQIEQEGVGHAAPPKAHVQTP
ncbi:MAG: flippase-like domain-containing protein [Planctomycetaceae bacterium]|nr:flippase-like domain-containing protein [Planctomycetaceae bacterium]